MMRFGSAPFFISQTMRQSSVLSSRTSVSPGSFFAMITSAIFSTTARRSIEYGIEWMTIIG